MRTDHLIKDDKVYYVKSCWTPNGPLMLKGSELKMREDLDGSVVYEYSVNLDKIRLIIFRYDKNRM